MSSDQTEEVFTRPFVDLLAELNRGITAAELTDKLHDLVQAVKDTGKKGSIAVQISLTPKNGDGVTVTAAVKASIPQPAARESWFYITKDCNLTSSDPNQLPFESLKVVDPATPELKEVQGK